ncbi:hypothetical protein TNCV_4845301 [Trichonephila clavipes]|uniref:Uncharacterized protein n=1 Tax=Trichonephila clavipes TaxID=2585209 RepID=A0A8X6WJD0_TRICX|nr:hypothetical protein TNCV_4845301 [Trichonephila clavipes]
MVSGLSEITNGGWDQDLGCRVQAHVSSNQKLKERERSPSKSLRRQIKRNTFPLEMPIYRYRRQCEQLSEFEKGRVNGMMKTGELLATVLTLL